MDLFDGPLRDFFPQLLADLREKQASDGTEDPVAFEAPIGPPFLGIQPQLVFLVLETPFPMPGGKAHQQQGAHRGAGRGVGQEELDLLRVRSTVRAISSRNPGPGKPVSSFG